MDDLFGGLDLKPAPAKAAAPAPAPADATAAPEPPTGSGFSFLNSPTPPTSPIASHASPVASAKAPLAAPAAEEPAPEPPAPVVSEAAPVVSEKPQPSFFDMMANEPVVAVPRGVIKKKLRARKVGYAREDDGADAPPEDAAARRPSLPPPADASGPPETPQVAVDAAPPPPPEPPAAAPPTPPPTPPTARPEAEALAAPPSPSLAPPSAPFPTMAELVIPDYGESEAADADAVARHHASSDADEAAAAEDAPRAAERPAPLKKAGSVLARVFFGKKESPTAAAAPAKGQAVEDDAPPDAVQEPAPSKEAVVPEAPPAKPPAEAKPAPPAPPAPAAELGERLDAFVALTTDLCFRLAEHERRASEMTLERESFSRDQAGFEADLKATLAQQQKLAEDEEYERADGMSAAVDSLRHEMALRATALKDLALEADKAERDVSKRRDAQRAHVEAAASFLRAFEQRQRESLKASSAQAASRRSAALYRVAAESDRLAMEKAHVERDAAHVAEEFERMETLIEAQTSVDAARREALDSTLAAKDVEIDELTVRLSTLASERDGLRAELGAAAAKIAEVRSKFERQLQRLEQREKMVKGSAHDCDAEILALEAEKRAVDEASDDADRRNAQAAALAEEAKVELDVARALQAATTLYAGPAAPAEKAQPAPAAAADHGLQVALAEAEESAHEAAAALKLVRGRLAALRAEKHRSDERLPQLEQDKKAAAASRAYKEAGALAKEAKACADKSASLAAQLDALDIPCSLAQGAADAARAAHDRAALALREHDRAAEVERLRRLRTSASELKRTRRQFERRAPTARLTAAAIKLVGVELANATARADDLCRRSNLQEYDVVEGDDDDNEPAPAVEEAPPAAPAAEEAAEEEAPPPPEEDAPPEDAPPPAEEEAPRAEEEEDAVQEPAAETAPADEGPDEAEVEMLAAVEARRLELVAQIADLETSIEAAVEAEDFDEADALDVQLADVRAQLEAFQ
ncbi:hypothetical protein M885DRAFT_585227 [Pelagophyceae sp. CCMP2097]|nr:hypothetical protein M885DRAFT_585227 [Pelagophyceae sp. CCMP2097]